MPLRRILALLFLLSATAPVFADAGDVKFVNAPVVVQDPLSKGTTEVELLGSYFLSPLAAHRPNFNYAGADLRLGIVLSPILMDHTPLRGNFEFLVDGFTDGVTNGAGKMIGVFTDGDFRRHMAVDEQLLSKPLKSVMTRNPICIRDTALAVDALKIFNERNIDDLIVINAKREPVGLIDSQDLPKLKIV